MKRGLHGSEFTWHIGAASGYHALNRLREIVDEYNIEIPVWSERVRLVTLNARFSQDFMQPNVLGTYLS